MDSIDEFSIGGGTDSDEENLKTYNDKNKDAKAFERKRIETTLLVNWPFKMELMKNFPYRSREGDVPTKLLRYPRLNYIMEIQSQIAKQAEE